MDATLDDAPCGFLTFGDDGVIRSANAGVARLLGCSAAALIGRKFEALLSIAGRIFCQTHFLPLLTLQGEANEIFLTLRAVDGSDVPMLVNARRCVENGGAETLCALMPVPGRKRYESELIAAKRAAEEALAKTEGLQELTRELEQSRQDLDRQVSRLSAVHADLARFSEVVSHDMQEPARKMAIFADLIRRGDGAALSPAGAMAVERITAASERLTGLIASLQQYVSVDARAALPQPCDLNALVEAARAKVEAEAAGVEIVFSAGPLPVVVGQAAQLELLAYHLIGNAVRFRKEGAAAAIAVDADVIRQNSYRSTEGKYRYAEFARIRFSDRGRGFDKAYEEYVFQLFERADGGDGGSGLGFGLALCRRIVESHGGSMSAKGVVGEGARFEVVLPVGDVSEA